MKKVFQLALFVLLSTCMQTIYAQVSTQKILTRVLDFVKDAEMQKGQILFMHVDNIDLGEEKSVYYTLKAGHKYGIIALGDDDRALDIDLSVSDDKAYKVGQDKTKANSALVRVQPKHDGIFVIHIKANEMIEKRKDGFYGLIIMRYADESPNQIDK